MLIWLGKQYLGQADRSEDDGEYKIIVEERIIGREMVLRREHELNPPKTDRQITAGAS